MTLEIYFAAEPGLWSAYRAPLTRALAEAGVDARLRDVAPEPSRVDVMVFSPGGKVIDFQSFTRLRAVLSLWAGVERILSLPGLTAPLCRMVDPAMTQGMTAYVAGHVLRHHLSIDTDLARQNGVWRPRRVPLPSERRVAVLGLGELGAAAALGLASLGFPVAGWSRSQRRIEGIECYAGAETLETVLRSAQILVTLLPHTPDTARLLNERHLGMLPEGAVIVNPGRGALIDERALLVALETGRVAHATLDVFDTEPLPPEHPFWRHPRVTVTPHIAAETQVESASRLIAENVRRLTSGEALLHVVDRNRGY